MNWERKDLIVELRRELERIGVTPSEAEVIASSQIDDSTMSGPGESPPQHVIAVAVGWIVVRAVPNLDIGLFDDRNEAIEAARRLADASGTYVVVHNGSGA